MMQKQRKNGKTQMTTSNYFKGQEQESTWRGHTFSSPKELIQ